MRTVWTLLGMLSALGLTAACGDAEPPTTESLPSNVERADSAGIEIVRNTAADRILEWSFSEVFSLGGDEVGDLALFRRSTKADEQGNVYVLDRGNHRILVFDSEGHHLRTLGREGGGPGELGIPVAFAVLPDGTVSVYDVRKHGLVSFGPDGSILPEERVDVGYTGGRLARSDRMVALTVQEAGTQAGIVVERVLEVGGEEPWELVRLEKAGPIPVTLPSCGITIADLPPLFQPSLLWTLRDTVVFANRGDAYAIDLVTSRGMLASYRRDLQPREATLEMAIAEVGEDMRFGPRVCTARDIAEQVGYAPAIPVIADIRAAPDHSLWVKRHTASEDPSLIDIIGVTGEYLGTLPPGSPFPAAFLPGDRLVAEEVDELGAETVVVYQIGRAGR
jgi:hypothetical protein